MAFFLRAQRCLVEPPAAKLDFAVLTAALATKRSLDAGTGPRPANPRRGLHEEEALVELLLAGPGWRQAASVQQGCFSRAEAGRRINGL